MKRFVSKLTRTFTVLSHISLTLVLFTDCSEASIQSKISEKCNNSGVSSVFGNRSLSNILESIAYTEMQECFLTIVYHESFANSEALISLVSLPNEKQIYRILDTTVWNEILWENRFCNGYIFLLDDATTQMVSKIPSWNYRGKYLIVTSTMEQLKSFYRSEQGKKTEHIIMVMKSQWDEKWVTYTQEFFPETKIVTINSGRPVFPQKFKDFKGKQLKVSIFEFEPLVLYQKNADGSVLRFGREIEIVKALTKAFNFQTLFVEPPNNEMWGWSFPNGTYNGMMGMITSEVADFTGMYGFVTHDRTLLMDLTIPHDIVPDCFMALNTQALPQWQSIFFPFSSKAWIALAAVLFFSMAIMYILIIILKSRFNLRKVYSVSDTIMIVLRVHFREATNMTFNENCLQVFATSLSIYCMIFTMAYSCNLTAFLSVQRFQNPMDTIEELVDSGMAVNEVLNYFIDAMAHAADPKIVELSKRVVTYDSELHVLDEVLKNKAVQIEVKPTLEFKVAMHTAFNGNSKFRIMKECLQTNMFALYLPKNSPMTKYFNKAIENIIESGLERKWFLDSITLAHQLKLKENGNLSYDEQKIEDTNGRLTSLNIEQLQGIFYILLIGAIFSVIAFALELAIGTIRNNKLVSK